MKRGRLALALGALAMVIASPSTGAPKRKNGTRPRVAPVRKLTPAEVLIGQLAINGYEPGENLYSACRRAKFKNLAIALNMNERVLTLDKQEFETTEEFDARAHQLDGVLADRQTIVCQPLNDNEDMGFTYNADRQEFAGSFSARQNVWRDVKQLGSYRSRTRMGIPMTVKASAELEYNVSFDLRSDTEGCLTGRYGTYSFTVPQQIALAPALKVSGYFVFLVRLARPYIASDESPGSPSLDNPYDVYTSTLTVHAKPERLVVVDAGGKEAWSCNLTGNTGV